MCMCACLSKYRDDFFEISIGPIRHHILESRGDLDAMSMIRRSTGAELRKLGTISQTQMPS